MEGLIAVWKNVTPNYNHMWNLLKKLS